MNATVYECVIPLTPVPKQGDRAEIIRVAGRPRINHRRSDSVAAYIRGAAPFVQRGRPAEPLDNLLIVDLAFFFAWPKRIEPRVKLLRVSPKSTRPDCDNLAKMTLDLLQAAEWFTDDARVFRLVQSKWYAAEAMTHAMVWEPDDGELRALRECAHDRCLLVESA